MKNISIVYECVSSIGNSLELEQMMDEVLKTFMLKTSALGAQFVDAKTKKVKQSVGKGFTSPNPLSENLKAYEIYETKERSFILDLPLGEENLLFHYKFQTDLNQIANMFCSFKNKLNNAIDACKSVEQLKANNINLALQVEAEERKNKIKEKMMINQSRMAVMGEMIGMIAHQWRQPITVIGMIANNTILDTQLGELKEEKLLVDMGSINSQVRYLSETIDDFRNFFSPDKDLQNVSSKEIYNDVLGILGNSLVQNNIDILFDGKDEIVFATYKNELVQVFLNIITNAKDAFLQNEIRDATLLLKTYDDDECIYFEVHDNAGGIPQEIISRVFEPYFTTKSASNGTGIGLYMSHTIVTSHLGGNLSVESKNAQTTFKISLPKLLVDKGEING